MVKEREEELFIAGKFGKNIEIDIHPTPYGMKVETIAFRTFDEKKRNKNIKAKTGKSLECYVCCYAHCTL